MRRLTGARTASWTVQWPKSSSAGMSSRSEVVTTAWTVNSTGFVCRAEAHTLWSHAAAPRTQPTLGARSLAVARGVAFHGHASPFKNPPSCCPRTRGDVNAAVTERIWSGAWGAHVPVPRVCECEGDRARVLCGVCARERVARGAWPGQHPELLPRPHTPPLAPTAQETSLPVTGPSSPTARTPSGAPHTPGQSPGLPSGPPAPGSPRQSTSPRLSGGSVWKRPVRVNALCTVRRTTVTWA